MQNLSEICNLSNVWSKKNTKYFFSNLSSYKCAELKTQYETEICCPPNMRSKNTLCIQEIKMGKIKFIYLDSIMLEYCGKYSKVLAAMYMYRLV